MSGQAIPFEVHAGQQLYVWCGGEPNPEELASAPPFTLFPAINKVKGELRNESPLGIYWDDIFNPYAFLGSRDDCPYCGDKDVVATVESFYAGDSFYGKGSVLEFFPDFQGELEGETISKPLGGTVTVSYDQAVEWALWHGYTLWKVPDKLKRPDVYMLFVIDELHVDRDEEGEPKHFFHIQTPRYDDIVAACGRPLGTRMTSEDVDVINRHRTQLGMAPIDPAAGWTPDELHDMAESIRATGRMTNLGELKASLMPPR